MISSVSQDLPMSADSGGNGGDSVPSIFGEVATEFESLLTGSGVHEIPWRAKVLLKGADRVRWLNGMVTNNVRDLPVGRGVYAFALNPQGRILGDLYAYNRGESLLIDIDRRQLEKMLALFNHFIIMDDVEVCDESEKVHAIGIKGPHARNALRSAGLDVAVLLPLEFVDLPWRDASLTVVRTDDPVLDSYEIWTSPEGSVSMLEALITAGAKPVGTAALNLLRIAEGIPLYGQDIRERDLPQETEQPRALHFTKGCYIGQEIVERIRSRGNVHRKFTGFKIDGPLPPPGTKIQVEGKEVGEVTSSVSLPLQSGPCSVALGYIRREAADKPIQVDGSTLTVTPVPFTEVFKH